MSSSNFRDKASLTSDLILTMSPAMSLATNPLSLKPKGPRSLVRKARRSALPPRGKFSKHLYSPPIVQMLPGKSACRVQDAKERGSPEPVRAPGLAHAPWPSQPTSLCCFCSSSPLSVPNATDSSKGLRRGAEQGRKGVMCRPFNVTRRSRARVQICCSLAMHPWGNCLISLCLSFSTRNWKVLYQPHRGVVRFNWVNKCHRLEPCLYAP